MGKNPTIYYYCYDHNLPSGGQKHTYRHVDILNKNGFDAKVLHTAKNFRLTWFDNTTPVVSYQECVAKMNERRDFLVLPEDLGPRILDFPGRKVIFNKNIFHGFSAFGYEMRATYPYNDRSIIAAFAVSDHNKKHLEFAYPRLPVYRVNVEIDPRIFSLRPLEQKKPQIACIGKAPELLLTVYNIIQSRASQGLNAGQSFRWVFLGNKSERETAQVLKDSLLFIFLNAAEGLGRMPLEAMACGSIVISCGAGPLAESIPLAGRFQHCEFIEMVQHIEAIMQSFPGGIAKWQHICQEQAIAARRFSPRQQEDGVISAWNQIIACGSPKLGLDQF